MTVFTTLEPKEKQKTVFHKFYSKEGLEITNHEPSDFDKVVFLGTCKEDGDTFAAYIDGHIYSFLGKRGGEFN
jgi:hypothetical protein